MGQVLHGCIRATGAIRRAIQDSKESIAKLSKYYNFSLKTIVFPKVNDKGIIKYLS